LVFPLDVVKTRLQVQNKLLKHDQDYTSAYDALLKILKNEGLFAADARNTRIICGIRIRIGWNCIDHLIQVVSSFSYFYIYSLIRGSWQKKIGAGTISSIVSFDSSCHGTISGCNWYCPANVAGALCQFIVLPIGIVTTRQQTDKKSKSFLATLKTLVNEEGVSELWKGLQA
jgi:hypothetical protein